MEFVCKERSVAVLYKEWQRIDKEAGHEYAHYKHVIQQDSARCFPRSRFLRDHKKDVLKLLRRFCRYSPVGYIQGMNFIACASLYMFQSQQHLAFWLFVGLFDNVKFIFLLQIDSSFLGQSMFSGSTEKVVATFLRQHRRKHLEAPTEIVELILKNLVQWRLIGTLAVTFLGDDLSLVPTLMGFYLPYLYDTKTFIRKAEGFALSFLFCSLMDKKLNEETIQAVQNANLSATALELVLETTADVDPLLK